MQDIIIQTLNEKTDAEIFNHLSGDAQNQVYQLKGDVRELRTLLAEAMKEGQKHKLDAQEFKKLANKNQEEADALRRAAGVSCDDTIGEGIAKVAALRASAS